MKCTRWLIGALVLPLYLCIPGTSAVARDKSFAAVLQGLEREYNVKPKRIPGLWLAKVVVKVAHPSGVSKVDFAVFEDDSLRELSAIPDLENRLNAMLGAGWKRFVEMEDTKRQERVLVFARPTGRRLEIFVFSAETDEAVALFARVNPKSLQRVLDDPPQLFAAK